MGLEKIAIVGVGVFGVAIATILAKNNYDVIITNGLFDFGELGYVVSKSKLLIGPSTCVTHLAEAFDVPIVELAGKGSLHKISNNRYLYEWYPWINKNKYKVLYHNEVCTECNLMNCRKKTIECMNAISVEEVINATEELLNKTK